MKRKTVEVNIDQKTGEWVMKHPDRERATGDIISALLFVGVNLVYLFGVHQGRYRAYWVLAVVLMGNILVILCNTIAGVNYTRDMVIKQIGEKDDV